MTSLLKKHEDGTIELTVTIPWEKIKKLKDEVINEYVKTAEIPGFRKGMAPKEIVEKNLDEAHLREDILKKILPESYVQALKEHNINPIINPKLHVEKLENEKDWVFTAFTAEAPEIILTDYKDKIKEITAKSKIIVPGKEPAQVNFEEISAILIQNSTVKIPKIISDQEVERLLSQTLDEIKKLGLTLDQYLSSTGRTGEALRKEYEKKAENDIKLEFLLQKIAETEGIKVEDKEIDEAITQAKSEQEKQNLMANRYLLANIIRQQKTLDFLRTL